MKIHLAGFTGGSLSSFWREYMRIYQAGTYSREYAVREAMKIFLAGKKVQGAFVVQEPRHLYILESFYYIRDSKWLIAMLPQFKGFLLDSGAFTFMQDSKNVVNWEKYVDAYADFINKHGIELFFELDIDSVVGLPETERLRDRLEHRTGKQCIPVWHKTRGKDYFVSMCRDYDYVAIGGIASREIKKAEHRFFPWFINIARKAGAKIHGLGFTWLEGLPKYHFDSVDSASWLYGNIGRFVYWFDGKTLRMKRFPAGRRMKSREVAVYNFNQWALFAEWAETNL